jgi:hypothetical protein
VRVIFEWMKEYLGREVVLNYWTIYMIPNGGFFKERK